MKKNTLITKNNIAEILPLTPLQEGMLFHSLMDKNNRAYVQQMNLHIQGSLDIDCLIESWNLILKRHEALRTAFQSNKNKTPVQIILKENELEYKYIDLTGNPNQAGLIEKYRLADRTNYLDLSKGETMRLLIMKVGTREYKICWTFHHILMDGWCAGIVHKELYDVYNSYMHSRPVALPPPLEYRKFIQWIHKQDRGKSREFWQRSLDGCEKAAILPTTPERLNEQDYDLGVHWTNIGKANIDRLNEMSALHNITPNAIINSIWALLVSKYNDSSDVVFGWTLSIRPSEIAEIERMVGLMINTIPFRVQIDDDDTLPHLAKKNHNAAILLRQHSYCPLPDILALSPMKENLFNHILVFENLPKSALDNKAEFVPGVEILASNMHEQTHYDLELTIFPGEEFNLRFSFNKNKYSEDDFRRVGEHFRNALGICINNPEQPLSQLDIIHDEEKDLILNRLSGYSEPKIESTGSLIEMIARSAQRTPMKKAVMNAVESLSYKQLSEITNAIANEIIANINNPEKGLSALIIPRSKWMVLGMIGSWKAGLAYVPIDPDYPQERIGFILEQTTPKAILTCADQIEKLSFIKNSPLIAIDQIDRIDQSPPEINVDKDDLAYVIFTSGSTGAPKGVKIAHKNLASFAPNLTDRFNLESSDVFLAATTYTFDISTLELILPLATGMTVYIADEREINNPDRFKELIGNVCNVLQITPSHLRLLLDDLGIAFTDGLKTLLVGGEPIPYDLYKTLAGIKETAVFNVYGPTETTIWSTAKRIEDERLVIGKPLINETVYILDSKFKPAPVGVEGDIYIGGDGVGDGYRKRPDLTEQAFFKNPFGHSEKMYLTGDRGKFLPNGDVEFLGRADYQIKVRGFRVEPGEIEHRIIEYPGVNNCVVVKGTGDFSEDLIAYYTGEEIADKAALKAHLKKFLTDYMIPTRFVHLERFPLLISGKINRKALPAPQQVKRKQKAKTSKKANQLKLEQLYRDALKIENIDWDDSFFDLGGHSLKAMRLAAAVRKEFMIDLELQDLFDHPTLNRLYRFIAGKKPSDIPWITAVEKQPSYPLSHSQRQIWMIDQINQGSAEYNMPSAIRIDKDVDAEILARAITRLAGRHETLRTCFRLIDNEPRQFVNESAGLDFETIDLADCEDANDRALKAIHTDAQTPFALDSAPLFRVKLYKLGGSSVLYLNIHHIISDEQSVEVFFEELLRIYRSLQAPESEPPPDMQIQYKDYSVWQRQFIQSKPFQKYEKYWLNRFSKIPEPLKLPADYVQIRKNLNTAGTVSASIDSSLSEKVRDYIRERNVTPFMYLLAAVNVLLYKYTSQSDLVIGLPASLRIHPELENQIGYYVNTLAIRNTIEGWTTFPEFLKKVRIETTRAQDNHLYPFDLLIEKLGVNRDERRNPLFNVMVVFEESADDSWWEGDYQIETIPIREQSGKFDLVFQFKWSSQGLKAGVNYNKALFESGSIDRALSHFVELNRSIITGDQLSIDRLKYMPDDELEKVTTRFNSERIPVPDKDLVEIIEYRAKTHPDSPAVKFEDRTLTFSELNDWANQVAHNLINAVDIQADDIIPVLMRRSDSAIAAVLGVLKTGAAFLPLDADLPAKRIEYILNDCDCKVLVKSPPLNPPLQIASGETDPANSIKIIDVETFTRRNLPNLERNSNGGDLAYMIYTSGTTGEPKGVMIERRSILTTVLGQGMRMGITSADTILQFSSLSFDASAMEIFLGLLHGACLVPVGKDAVMDPDLFERTLDKYRVTAATLPPGYIASLRKGCLKKLRVLASVAENARVEDAAYYGDFLRYCNGYGPTEAAVCSAFYAYDSSSAVNAVPIGKPLPNTRIYILDKNQQPVPIGTPGEIYIGGDNVARGYYKRKTLTEERFIPDPFDPEVRLFKSGDMGKWLPDGNILYLDRADDMVKIRGFRIEPKEVETTLNSYRFVERSVVVARSKGAEKTLFAYLIAKPELSVERLKKYLRERLPGYMIPSRFIKVDSFPLTENGKIDRDALPDPSEEVRTAVKDLKPLSETERKLADLWRKILELDSVNPTDSFFEIGGNSLTAIQMVQAIKSDFSVSASAKDLFGYQTIRQMSEFIDEQRKSSDEENLQSFSDKPPKPTASEEDRKFLRITGQRLEKLIETNELPHLDAAAFGYFTEEILVHTKMTAGEFLSRIAKEPILSDVIETPLGVIGYVILPRFTETIYKDKDELLKEINQAVNLSECLGAKSISLTGLIPSATNYGKDILDSVGTDLITTGHATTIGTILMQVDKASAETKRSLENETVAALGLGSVGSVFIQSMLKVFPHPAKIILCDIFNKRGHLEELREMIMSENLYNGEIEILFSNPYPPAEFYESRFIIGAANVPDILMIDNLKPGSILIDDSGPHCFNLGAAVRRIQEKSDILITEGGTLHIPENLKVAAYLPRQMQDIYAAAGAQPYQGFNPRHLTGCVLSSALTLKDKKIKPTVGIPLAEDCVMNYQALKKYGFTGAEFHFGSYVHEDGFVNAFIGNRS